MSVQRFLFSTKIALPYAIFRFSLPAFFFEGLQCCVGSQPAPEMKLNSFKNGRIASSVSRAVSKFKTKIEIKFWKNLEVQLIDLSNPKTRNQRRICIHQIREMEEKIWKKIVQISGIDKDVGEVLEEQHEETQQLILTQIDRINTETTIAAIKSVYDGLVSKLNDIYIKLSNISKNGLDHANGQANPLDAQASEDQQQVFNKKICLILHEVNKHYEEYTQYLNQCYSSCKRLNHYYELLYKNYNFALRTKLSDEKQRDIKDLETDFKNLRSKFHAGKSTVCRWYYRTAKQQLTRLQFANDISSLVDKNLEDEFTLFSNYIADFKSKLSSLDVEMNVLIKRYEALIPTKI